MGSGGNSRQRRINKRAPHEGATSRSDIEKQNNLQAPRGIKENPKNTGRKFSRRLIRAKRLVKRALAIAATLASIWGIFSAFFPNLTVSDPETMNSAELLSKHFTVKNDGNFPVFCVRCEFNPEKIVMADGSSIDGPGRLLGARAGTLFPGDSYTFTTEHFIGAPTARTMKLSSRST
jgi:hypothetical protein